MVTRNFTEDYLNRIAQVAAQLDRDAIERLVALLAQTRAQGGRVFVLGVGGSAANAGHLVNDLRKLAGIEAYAPTDNVAELTARTNDEGWETVFSAWLATSRLQPADLVFVLSVGGGSRQPAISANLVHALDYARQAGSRVAGIVGRDGGYTARMADACVVVPTVDPHLVTPLAEAFQAVVWHLAVSHPALRRHEGRWEAAAPEASAP
jgi:D-sedoheptulose 7-phosphate isomerase